MSSKVKTTSSTPTILQRIFKILPIFVCVAWFITVVSDYLFNHSYFTNGIAQFNYWGLLIGLGIILGGTYYFMSIFKKKTFTINGLKLYGIILLLMNVILGVYGMTNQIFESTPIQHLSYFTGFTLLVHLGLLYIIVVAYGLGSFVFDSFIHKFFTTGTVKLISIAVGFSLLGLVLVIIGLFNGLTIWVVWALVLIITILRYKTILQFLKGILLNPIPIQNLKIQGLAITALLLIVVSVNLIGATKAFPIGFDGAGLYINTSKLIAEYQGLPEGGQAFNWSVIMSLGMLMYKSTTISILLAHLTGILCMMVVYRIARMVLSQRNALLATAILYTAPFFTFHNTYDEKVDFGFLFISLSVVLLLLEYYFKKNNHPKLISAFPSLKIGNFSLNTEIIIWLIAGSLMGFAFGIKYIAIFHIIGCLCFLAYQKSGQFGFWAAFLLALASVFLLGIYRFSNVALDGSTPLILGSLFLVAGVACIVVAYRKTNFPIVKTLSLSLTFIIVAAFTYLPWVIKHSSEHKTISLTKIIEGKSPQPKLKIKKKFLIAKKERQQTNKNKTKSTTTKKAKREEVQRYIGFENGFPLYLSLPYDLTMNTNIPNSFYVDIGFIWWLLLPLLLLSFKNKSLVKNGIYAVLVLLVFCVSILSVYVQKGNPNMPETLVENHPEGFQGLLGGLYQFIMNTAISISQLFESVYDILTGLSAMISIISLVLITVLVSWLFAEKLQMMRKSIKGLLVIAVPYAFMWFILGSAIPWYGFLFFALLAIVIAYFYEHSNQFLNTQNSRFAKYFMGTSLGLYLVLNLFLIFTAPDASNERHLIYKTPFANYVSQAVDADAALAGFNPSYLELLKYLNKDTNEKIYRIGTHIEYHILQNDQRVIEDNQLGQFDEIQSKVKKDRHFIKILRNNGFRYILYDLNTASLDKTPEQSLVKKNTAFVNMLQSSRKIKPVLTDRIVEDPNGGYIQIGKNRINGMYGLQGKVIYPGSFILFEIGD